MEGEDSKWSNKEALQDYVILMSWLVKIADVCNSKSNTEL